MPGGHPSNTGPNCHPRDLLLALPMSVVFPQENTLELISSTVQYWSMFVPSIRRTWGHTERPGSKVHLNFQCLGPMYSTLKVWGKPELYIFFCLGNDLQQYSKHQPRHIINLDILNVESDTRTVVRKLRENKASYFSRIIFNL